MVLLLRTLFEIAAKNYVLYYLLAGRKANMMI